MTKYNTLIDLLDDQLETSNAVRFITGADEETVLTFPELRSRAIHLLGAFQDRGMEPGDELIILTGSNEHFLVAFWAAILGGIIPIPIAVGINDEQRLKLFRIAAQLKKPTLFTDETLQTRLKAFAQDKGVVDADNLLEAHCVTDVDNQSGRDGVEQVRKPEDLAFVQFSSGSTSEPKGVCLTHENLTTTLDSMANGLILTEEDSALSWMPLTHDMGLIGYHLTFLGVGLNHAIMDTSMFVRRPLIWLSMASELGATVLCSPNFGYKHYLKMFARKSVPEMDLSRVRLLLNGAEPISHPLCQEFLDALAPYGLKRTAMFPVYGLAEATLAVSFPSVGEEYTRIMVKRHSLRIGSPYAAANPDDEDAVSFVKLGTSIDDCEFRIVDADDVAEAEGYVGNIHIRGKNITRGFYRNPEMTRELFAEDGWLRTGDCGVCVDGELVVTGRAKDIIIVNGQNYYPHDIEEIIGKLDGLELGKVVVSGVIPSPSEVEELLVFILHRKDLLSFRQLTVKIRDIVGAQAGLEVNHVMPVTRIPKTTSGKIQRSKLAEEYLDGHFATVLAELKQIPILNGKKGGNSKQDPMVIDLLAICAEFSRDRKIGARDNLFEIGISSLTLTEIMLAVEEKHPGKIDINDLFDYPTITELSQYLATKA